MKKYRLVEDLTSDVMFEAYGRTMEELFANAAEALFSVMCYVGKVQPKEKREVRVSAESVEGLAIAWLQELIALVDTDVMFFSKFRIKEFREKPSPSIVAEAYGEPASPEKGKIVVKAVTRYGFALQKDGGGYKLRVALDI